MRARPAAPLLTLTALALLPLAGCDRAPDVLVASFPDELVEAPARRLEVAVIRGTPCATLLSVLPAEVEAASGGEVLARLRTPYPPDPGEDLLAGLPRGEPLAFHATALDATGVVVGRACAERALDPAAPTAVELALLGLQPCQREARALDLAVVMDTSLAMRLADIGLGGTTVEAVTAFLEDGFSAGSVFSVVGGETPDAVPAPAPAGEAVAALRALEGVYGGAPRPFAQLSATARALRARATCQRRPAILALAGGRDAGPAGDLENAVIGLVGARGTAVDDLFTFAIALDPEARADLDLAVPAEVGAVAGARTEASLAEALRVARFRLQALVGM
jgi:hypothetical protein